MRRVPTGGGSTSPLAGVQRQWRLFAVVAVAVMCRLLVEPVAVGSDSMAPTLRPGDHVAVERLSLTGRSPSPGDLITFREPASERLTVKRLIALPGQSVGIEDGRLRVDGRWVDEPYVDHDLVDSTYFGPVVVPADAVFVLGDNRSTSIDSRDYGAVPREDVVGRVVIRLWPPLR